MHVIVWMSLFGHAMHKTTFFNNIIMVNNIINIIDIVDIVDLLLVLRPLNWILILIMFLLISSLIFRIKFLELHVSKILLAIFYHT